jgi:flavin reductase (DIM6/NTAB) family NADH-FMN oxidoreductase RutF
MQEKIQGETLKAVMRTWITGVAIVTARLDHKIHGMTANSFNAIALKPPTVLIALQKHTRTRNLVHQGGYFGVNILQSHQRETAMRFAGQLKIQGNRFADLETFELVSGVPFIKGGLAYLDCQVKESFEVGATTVFLGEVLAVMKNTDDQQPLLYYNRKWRKLEDPQNET